MVAWRVHLATFPFRPETTIMHTITLTALRVLALIDAIRNKRWSGNGRPIPVTTALRGGSSILKPWDHHRPGRYHIGKLRA